MNQPSQVQSIDTLVQRYQKLDESRIVAETNLKNAQGQLEELQLEAKQQFGTAELEELKSILHNMQQENEKLQLDYQQHLDQVEANLAQVEKEYAATQA